jgi:hypothetical protein
MGAWLRSGGLAFRLAAPSVRTTGPAKDTVTLAGTPRQVGMLIYALRVQAA